MLENKRIAGIWSNYYPGSDGNPHEYLNENGWDSTLITAEYLDDGNSVKSGIHFMDKIDLKNKLKPLTFSKRVINKLSRPFYWKKFNRYCEQIITEKRVELIHAHFGYTAVRILPIIKKTKIPLVVTFYGIDGSQMLKEAHWVKGYKEMFNYASKLVVLCEEVKTRLVKIGCDSNKIVVWQIPINLGVYQYKERNPADVFKLVIGARFVEKKGYKYLFKAFKKLLSEGRDVKLSVIGYGNYKCHIEELIKTEKLTEHVNLIDTSLKPGFAEFFNEELGKHDVFVLPSIASEEGDDEGGPSLTLVAAQAAGLPVICTAFPGAEITVFDRENGLICLPNDVDSLYDKMVEMINMPENWNEMGKKGSDLVHKLFKKETQMPILERIFEKSLKESNL